MKVAKHFAFASAVLAATPMVWAYDLGTHALMTLRVHNRSQVGTTQETRDRLGVSQYVDNSRDRNAPLGSSYFDVSGNTVIRRDANDYEASVFPQTTIQLEGSLSFSSWMMRGVVREDDIPTEVPLMANDDPVNAFRLFNHFYDPVYDRPLTVDGIALGKKNPDWALGSQNAFSNPPAEDALRENHFSLVDAREAMWRALTLTDKDNAQAPGGDLTKKPKIRKAYWATTFRALGDVIHLVQDLGQPQHTRNEAHTGMGPGVIQRNITGHGTVYENYIEARALRNRVFGVNIDGTRYEITTPSQSVPLDAMLDGYSVQTSKYADLWSNGQGTGLANYSNAGFFTQTKNVGNTEYGSPNSGALTPCDRPASDWAGGLNSTIAVRLLCGTVHDNYTSSDAHGIALAAEGLWDQFAGPARTYQLVKENYDDQAALLLPRAVGYSVGLIDYFFRGALTVELPPEGLYAIVDQSVDTSFKKLRIAVSNATAVDSPGQGTLVAVVKYHKNVCFAPDLSGEYGYQGRGRAGCRGASDAPQDDFVDFEEIAVSKTLLVDGISASPTVLDFDFGDSAIPFGSSDLTLQVVFRGVLGNEQDGIAVGSRDISEPSYLTYINATDYIHLGNRVYTRNAIASRPDLLDQITLPNCVDRTQSTPQLDPECLTPTLVSMTLTAPQSSATTVTVNNLPAQRFLRFAFLTNGGQPGSKAAFSQTTTCLPSSAMEIQVANQQLTLDETFSTEPISTLRGVNGQTIHSCVLNGDNSDPSSPDDRLTVMAPLSGTDATTPFAVTIAAPLLQ